MNSIKQMLPYVIIQVISFYVIPLLITDTGTFMVLLLIVFPLVCMLSSIMYGAKYGFSILYTIVVASIFATTIFIYYNLSASIYIAIYFVIALLGNAIGMLIKLRKDK